MKNKLAQERGRKGGQAKVKKGLATASPERRSEIASMGGFISMGICPVCKKDCGWPALAKLHCAGKQ